jgi:hypothetical protein
MNRKVMESKGLNEREKEKEKERGKRLIIGKDHHNFLPPHSSP